MWPPLHWAPDEALLLKLFPSAAKVCDPHAVTSSKFDWTTGNAAKQRLQQEVFDTTKVWQVPAPISLPRMDLILNDLLLISR